MKTRLIAIGLFVANAFGAPALSQQEHTPADILIMHAKIYTVNARRTKQEQA